MAICFARFPFPKVCVPMIVPVHYLVWHPKKSQMLCTVSIYETQQAEIELLLCFGGICISFSFFILCVVNGAFEACVSISTTQLNRPPGLSRYYNQTSIPCALNHQLLLYIGLTYLIQTCHLNIANFVSNISYAIVGDFNFCSSTVKF